MVARAAPAAEKWFRHLNRVYEKTDDFTEDIIAFCKKTGGYEDGILNDMAIANDVGRICIFAERRNGLLLRGIDDFDAAAEQLNTMDRQRYYAAKARIRSGLAVPAIDSIKQEWLVRLVNDCCRASQYGFDAEKCSDFVGDFTGRFKKEKGSVERVRGEAVCRITQHYARFLLAEAKSFHRRHEYKKAYKSAVKAIDRVPASSVMDTALCARWKSEDELLTLYDSVFIRPFSLYAGTYGDEFRTEVCNKFWAHRRLVALVIVRIRTPSSDAFDLFEKAGEDVILRHDGRIAVTELSLWKKAGRLKDFKKEFPDRYAFARRASASRNKP